MSTATFEQDAKTELPTTDRRNVAQAAMQCLQQQSYQLRRVVCDYREGVLSMRGKVASFYLRQMALVAVRRLEGVEEVCDRLEVVDPMSRANSSIAEQLD